MSTDVLSPYWGLSINGTSLSTDLKRRSCVSSLSIKENSDGSDTLTVVVSDPDLLFIEDDIFVEDAKVSASLGFNEDTYRVNFNGYVSAIDIDFPDIGVPALTLTCLDKTHLMNRTKKSRSWENVTRPEVVKKIASEHGFKCVVQNGYTFKKEDTITQSKQTDIEFIESLAEEEKDPFSCKLVGDTIYYTKLGLLSSPVATLVYKKYPYTLMSFQPQITKEDINSSVSVGDITTDTKETDKGKADKATETQGEEVTSSESATGSSNIHYSRSEDKWVVD